MIFLIFYLISYLMPYLSSHETGNSRYLPSISSINTVQKMKFSVNDVFSKCDQIPSFLRISSHLLKKSLMINFIVVKRKIYILYERHIFKNNVDHIQYISHVIDIYQTFKYHWHLSFTTSICDIIIISQ